jgi:diguanylate cyclase (GGDEF)-like protein
MGSRDRRERRAAAYAGIKLSTTRKLAMNGWAAGIAIACLLMLAAPPTAQLGAAGWIAGAGIQVVSAAGWLALRLRPARVTFGVLLVVTWLLPLDIAAMQWLGGGWSAPYHELLLPALILGSAGLPPRRFAPFAVAVVALALAPALYAPDSEALLGMLAELAVWSFVIGALAVLMARIRGQARLARSDQLTRLANRRALDELFDGPRTGVVTLGIGDLDGFKQINDRHGHLAGDECLVAVGQTLARCARASDQTFRWGGDEFAVLLPGTSGEAARPLFERLEAAISEHVRDPDGAPIRITFGWASGDAATDLRTLTEAADAALLARKPRRGQAATARSPIRSASTSSR